MKKYIFSKEIINLIKDYLKKQPFIEVINIFNLLQKDSLTEDEANMIINYLGQKPYEDVVNIFLELPKNINIENDDKKEENNS